jgi:hypothetical protein
MSTIIENNMGETEAHEKHTQLKALHSVARALLLEIRDRKGYLALGFSSFEEYGEKEWGYTRTYINRLANAEKIQQSISVPIGTKEIPENQLRELGKVPAELRDEIYQQAKAESEAENKEITAKLIKEKAEAVKELNHLDNLYQHQSKDVDKVIKEHSALVEEFNELEAAIDAKAEQWADIKLAEKLKIKTTELQATLNEQVAINKPLTSKKTSLTT